MVLCPCISPFSMTITFESFVVVVVVVNELRTPLPCKNILVNLAMQLVVSGDLETF